MPERGQLSEIYFSIAKVGSRRRDPSWWITNVNLAPGANDGLLANFASVLVRPDGYLAHVQPAKGAHNGDRASDPPARSSAATSGDPKMLAH